MDSPWEEVRRDFPCLKEHVYLNTASAGPTPHPVRAAVNAFYRSFEESGDGEWDQWLELRETVRAKVARLLGADADEIAFVPNTSTGINLIVDLLGDDGPVLSDELEFPSVTLPWIHRGTKVHFMPAVEGVIRLESFAPEHAPRASTIAISHVQFANGCRLDLDAFGAAKGDRRLVICGSQAVGAFPVDVRRSAIDALAATGHTWLCAGYGTGFVYVKREILAARPPRAIGWMSVEDPFAFDNRRARIVAGNRRTELGCPAFAQIFALGAAIDYIQALGMDAIADRVLALNMYLTFRLSREGFEVLSPAGDHRSGQTLCLVPEPAAAHAFLKQRGVSVTHGQEGIRIATHFFNTEQDVDACVQGLIEYRQTL